MLSPPAWYDYGVRLRTTVLAAISSAMALAQLPPENPPPDGAPPAKPVMIYSGKPLSIPFACSDEDMQWGGMSCTEEEPCPIYLELSALEAVGGSLFVSGNLHSAATTLYSVLLASSDSGKNWTEPVERIRGAGLDQIQFIDFESGWISGQHLHPLPQDPFLLITNDGGKTWRRQPVFGETRFASVVQFWFTSKNDGAIVVDRGQSSETSRYEKYETPNGGDTWMIRETNDQAIRLRRTPPNADWRIRADGPTQSFRIEQRQGNSWTAVSAFAIRAGQCKPPERTFAEPPPEPVEPAPEPEPPPAAAPPRGPRRPPTLKKP
jgi:photosystem II stability/assembly factor-like uncharacterized protein